MLQHNLVSLSQASLQDYADCARRFQLRYLERLNYPALESEPALENEKHQQQGQYFHRLVHQYWLGLPSKELAERANTPELRRWWENFLATDFRLSGYTKRPEFTLSAPLGPYRLVAKYDLLAVLPDHKVVILDWKTYRKRPRPEWLAARLQTRVYRALVAQAGAHLNRGTPFAPEQIELIYWFSDFPREPVHLPYDAAQFKRDWDLLTKLAQEVAAEQTFPKTDDLQKCSYCPYRSYCNRGTRAGDFAQAEAELEAEELFDVNFEQIGEIAF